MPLLVAALITLSLVAGATALLLRQWTQRSIGYLTASDLLVVAPSSSSSSSSSGTHQHQPCQVARQLTDLEIQTVVEAFGHSKDMIWTVQGDYSSPVRDRHKFNTLVTYMMVFVIRIAEYYGHIITYRLDRTNDDQDEQVTNDDFGGSLCLVPVPSSRQLFAWMAYVAVAVVGQPPVQDDDKPLKARFDAWQQSLQYHHQVMEEYCNEQTASAGKSSNNKPQHHAHWWIANLAVAPQAQGRGVGTALLQQAKALAMRDGQCLFLECTDHNVPYYQKHGFVVRQRYFLTPANVKGEDEDPFATYPMNAMVYDPAASASDTNKQIVSNKEAKTCA